MRGACGLERVEVPGSGSVRLEARKYILYLEGTESDEAEHPVKIVMRHRRSERRVSAAPYKGSYSFEPGEEVPLTAVATVTPPLAGVYDVRTDGHDDLYGFDLAFGEKTDGQTGWIILGTFLIAGVLGFAGLAVLIAGGARLAR